MADIDVAAMLRTWRGRAFLTQEQLARRTGLGVRTIRRLEAGRGSRPRNDSLRLLAEALELSDRERALLVTAARGDAAADVPRQLPRDVPGFTGRTEQLEELDLRSTGDGPAIVLLTGTAGVGKTALAVHWAHQTADRFDDGQLYVNLRGFDPGGTPMDPVAAMRGFLDALNVSPERVPLDPDARSALYRTLLAGRRMLVLLDNARDAGQVRPLLPGAAGCLVLVTSRDQLAGLVATEGASQLRLDPLSAVEAGGLLARRVGANRLAAQPAAAEEIITICAGLPLALAIAAAHAATRPELALDDLAGELRGSRLDVLSTGEAATDVRALFSWSYECLGADAARLFRLLGVHPGPDVSAAAAASLAGISPADVLPLLTELAQAHLITEHIADRYTFHDLLRGYAAELARGEESDAALRRALGHYVQTGRTAALLLYPPRRVIGSPPDSAGVHVENLSDQQEAMAWFTAEHQVLIAAIRLAADLELDEHTWHLAWTLPTFLERRHHLHDLTATQDAALLAAQRLGDPRLIASAYRTRARAASQLGHNDDAYDGYCQALEICRDVGDRLGQAIAHGALGDVLQQQGRHRQAIDHSEQAAALYHELDHLAGHADALNTIGWSTMHLGECEQAVAYCQKALALQQQIGNQYGIANSWHSIGYAYQHLRQHLKAIDCYRHARDGFQAIGVRYFEAATLRDLGDAHRAAGEPEAARGAWRKAVAILDDLGHPEADEVRTRLT